MSRFMIYAVALFAFLAVPLAVRAQDELAAIRARQEIAAQKLTAQVAQALGDSRKIERTDAREAKYLLQRTMTRVRDSQDLALEKRASLVRQLQTRINEIDDAAAARRAEQSVKPYSQKPASRPPTTYDEPRKGVGSVAKGFQDSARNAVQIAQDAARQRNDSIRRIGLAQEKSPPYPTDDQPVVVSKADWDRARERGKPRLTEKEAKLLKALNSVMTPNFDGDKFSTVMNYLQEKTSIVMIFDQASVEEARLDYEDTVTFKLPTKVEVRTILKKILGDKGLTYIIKEGSLQIVTPKKARETVVVRAYPVSDLIQPSQAARMFGPFVAQAQMMQNAQQLISLIQLQIDPGYWEPNGPGRIGFYPASQSLIITGSAEMHYQLGGMGLLSPR